MSMQDTPNAARLHIGIFGKVNSGKSTLLNAITSQQVSLVSEQKGTTTDPVYKAMEIRGLGAVVFIDTAGFEDTSALGAKRLEKTLLASKKSDVAIFVFADTDVKDGTQIMRSFREQGVNVIAVVNDMGINNASGIVSVLKSELAGEAVVVVDALKGAGIEELKEALIERAPAEEIDITGNLVHDGSLVLLVMPQDIQAPKGRLILPQVQTLRELLDKKCIVMSCTTDKIDETLAALGRAPDLVICDSQVFDIAEQKKPPESKLTSFSILFAAYKGDIESFIAGAKAIDGLTESSHVLIAEACTHAPQSEDIGRVKIPGLLGKRFGCAVTVVSGTDFPQDLSGFDLVIHCGACMFNRKYVLSRLGQAKRQGVPITNYGIVLAHLKGILDRVSF